MRKPRADKGKPKKTAPKGKPAPKVKATAKTTPKPKPLGALLRAEWAHVLAFVAASEQSKALSPEAAALLRRFVKKVCRGTRHGANGAGVGQLVLSFEASS